jgi:Mg-chelatase subunit ChlD
MRELRSLCIVIIFAVTTACLPVGFSFAETPAPGLDLMFVVDCSGSMKSNDPEESTKELLGLFAAVSDPESVRIGVTAYSDKITVALPLVNLANEYEKDMLSAAISTLVPKGDTDIGLGLARAKELLSEDSSRARAVVLISDGETYTERGGRGKETSDREAEDMLLWAKENNVPVHSVAVGNYDGSTEFIERLSGETGGSLRHMPNPEAVSELLETLLVL